MNLMQIFSGKPTLELALAVTALSAGSREREALLAEAGLVEDAAAGFLRTVQVFDLMRVQAGCAACQGGHCLDENTLAELVDGILPAEEQAAVEGQLAQCAACLGKAVALAQLMHELAPAPRWNAVVLGIARRGLRILSAPFEGYMEQELQPVAVLSAGTEETTTRRWRQEDRGVSAIFTVVLEEGGTIGLSMDFEYGGRPLTRGNVALRLDDTLLEARPIAPDDEQQTFWGLEPGNYLVEVLLEEGEAAGFPIVLEHACEA